VARRDKSLYRRRRRVAAGVLVVVVAGGSLAIEGALGDESFGPGPAEIEKTALSAVPDSALLAQKLMVRMDGTATPALIRQAREGEIGGVIVFPPPGQPPDELRAQIERLQNAARGGDRPPLLVAIDQEGGEVKRLPEAPPERSPAELAAPGDERAARVAGRETGRYLARLGINVDLAPVLDVPSSPSSFIAARAFGTDPRVVAANGTAFAEGLQAGGVISAVKHFPGLGKAVANTDLEPSEIESREAALGEDLAPFREAIARDVRMVMVGLATYTSIDPEAPAGLSEAIVEGLLRRELGFDGVVISDDLGAGAVQAVASEREAPVSAARAGIDILLFAKTADGGPTREALLDALRSGELSRDELERSLVRILALKEGL
jgi:beta-N-acetylhexosaminidase